MHAHSHAAQKEHERMIRLLIATILMAIALALAIRTNALESAVANYRAGLLSRTRVIRCTQRCSNRYCPAGSASTCRTCVMVCG